MSFDVFVAVAVLVAFATLYVFTNVSGTRVHIAFVIRFCEVQCSRLRGVMLIDSSFDWFYSSEMY